MAGAPVVSPSLVLGTLRYGETSRIVRLATRDAGVQSAIAKGADRPRSRFGAALQLLSEGHAHLIPSRSSDLHLLTAFDLSRLHHGLARGIERFAAASALAEVAGRFIPTSPMPELFDALVDDVALLEAVDEDAVGVVALRALWGLVGHLGLTPILDACARDGAPLATGGAVFSVADGGLLCSRCARPPHSALVDEGDRAALKAFTTGTGELPILSERHAAAHRRLYGRWVRHHLTDAPLPALDFWQRRDTSG
ncbi:MAG: DNA repair protein RecO [Gemmatimonadales bacterium]|nr:DNA repair protein RecO [Gemmatimonadales bacterium]